MTWNLSYSIYKDKIEPKSMYQNTYKKDILLFAVSSSYEGLNFHGFNENQFQGLVNLWTMI